MSCSVFLNCASPPGTRPEALSGHAALSQKPDQSGSLAKACTRAAEFGSATAVAAPASTQTATNSLPPDLNTSRMIVSSEGLPIRAHSRDKQATGRAVPHRVNHDSDLLPCFQRTGLPPSAKQEGRRAHHHAPFH